MVVLWDPAIWRQGGAGQIYHLSNVILFILGPGRLLAYHWNIKYIMSYQTVNNSWNPTASIDLLVTLTF